MGERRDREILWLLAAIDKLSKYKAVAESEYNRSREDILSVNPDVARIFGIAGEPGPDTVYLAQLYVYTASLTGEMAKEAQKQLLRMLNASGVADAAVWLARVRAIAAGMAASARRFFASAEEEAITQALGALFGEKIAEKGGPLDLEKLIEEEVQQKLEKKEKV